MRVRLAWGRQEQDIDVTDGNLVPVERAPLAAPLADPAQALRDALERPLDYPPLRRSLTPDDRVTVVIDEGLPRLASLLLPVLEQIAAAGVQPEAITLLCRPPSGPQAWVDALPDAFQDVRIEVHQPDDRKRLSYLATTKQGRRVYLNRSAVDADQLILLARRQYDPLLGYVGGETALFPGLGDEATRREFAAQLEPRRARQTQHEAAEVAWLLGAPFLIQAIEGEADTIADVLTGPPESAAEGIRRYDRRWKVVVARPAEVAIATITGDAAGVTSEEVARAFFNAARVVRPGGAIVVLTAAAPTLGRSFELLRQQEDPGAALEVLKRERPDDFRAGYLWASAATQAKLYLLGGLPAETVEDLHAIPLEHARQVQRLLTAHASYLLLPDAHKTRPVLREE